MAAKQIDVAEFCERFKMSRTMLYSLWRKDQGPPKEKVKGKVMIKLKDAQAWNKARKATANV